MRAGKLPLPNPSDAQAFVEGFHLLFQSLRIGFDFHCGTNLARTFMFDLISNGLCQHMNDVQAYE
jgi:hypothetical protein